MLHQYPRELREIFESLRRRYQALRLQARPTLDDPRSYIGLVRMGEANTLAIAGCWPLPEEVRAFLRTPLSKSELRRLASQRVAGAESSKPRSLVQGSLTGVSKTQPRPPGVSVPVVSPGVNTPGSHWSAKTNPKSPPGVDAPGSLSEPCAMLTRSRKEAAGWWNPLGKFHYLQAFPPLMDYAILAPEEKGLIIIGHAARFSRPRNQIFPALWQLPWAEQAAWLKANLRVLARVVVRPDCRRQGLASELIQAALKELPCPYLEVYAHPQVCGELFKKNGFQQIFSDGRRAKIEGMPEMPGAEYWVWGRGGDALRSDA